MAKANIGDLVIVTTRHTYAADEDYVPGDIARCTKVGEDDDVIYIEWVTNLSGTPTKEETLAESEYEVLLNQPAEEDDIVVIVNIDGAIGHSGYVLGDRAYCTKKQNERRFVKNIDWLTNHGEHPTPRMRVLHEEEFRVLPIEAVVALGDDDDVCEDCNERGPDCTCNQCSGCGHDTEDCCCNECGECGCDIDDCTCDSDDTCEGCGQDTEDCTCEDDATCDKCGENLDNCTCTEEAPAVITGRHAVILDLVRVVHKLDGDNSYTLGDIGEVTESDQYTVRVDWKTNIGAAEGYRTAVLAHSEYEIIPHGTC